MKKRQTAGQLSLKASADRTIYKSMEVAMALTEDIGRELMICAHRHKEIFDESEYCVGYVIASDMILKNLQRRKFFAMLYLPSPRPNQSVFLYNKAQDRFTKVLWILPNPATMAELSQITTVDKKFRRMKGWCDAFFAFKFWEHIREQSKTNILSEIEYLNANREELIKANSQNVNPSLSHPLDFGQVSIDKIANPNTIISE
jgi:hypothetical protein